MNIITNAMDIIECKEDCEVRKERIVKSNSCYITSLYPMPCAVRICFGEFKSDSIF
jgi:hypothetical protein